MKRDELAAGIREAAYLEGDFVLRSGRHSTYYLDKYRFETRPEPPQPLGEQLAALVAEHEPDAVRLARSSWVPSPSRPRRHSSPACRS